MERLWVGLGLVGALEKPKRNRSTASLPPTEQFIKIDSQEVSGVSTQSKRAKLKNCGKSHARFSAQKFFT
jgi:hypothetical protein